MNSIGRRIERYRMIYCWKFIIRLVPNCGISYTNTINTGILFNEIPLKKYCKFERKNSSHYTAPRLFNKLLQKLRDDRDSMLLEWRVKLDKILKHFPDNPQVGDHVPGLYDPNSKPGNSLFYWRTHKKTLH